MTWSFRMGAVVTFTRDDGQPGAGQAATYSHTDGWTVEIQDEGCVQLSNYRAEPSVLMVVPWHRIYEIRAV
jgi:hypothetical protein